jgi:predicted transcriptional regulator
MRTPGRRPLLKKDLNAALRATQALELKVAGLSQYQIADQLGVNQSSVSRMIARALKQHKAQRVDEMRQVEALRLEALHQTAWEASQQGDWQAAAIVTRLLDRRAKLFGLDAAGANGEGAHIHYSVSAMVMTSAEARRVIKERLANPRPDPNVVYDQVSELPPWATADDIGRYVRETARGIIPQRPEDTVYMKTIIICRDRPPNLTTHGAPAVLAQPSYTDDEDDLAG